jgi:hypothetical protein
MASSGSGSGSGSGSRVVVHMKVPFSKVSQYGRVASASAQTVAARLRSAPCSAIVPTSPPPPSPLLVYLQLAAAAEDDLEVDD